HVLPACASLTRRMEMVLAQNQKSERRLGRGLLVGIALLSACLAVAGVPRIATAGKDDAQEISVEVRILGINGSTAARLGRDFAVDCLAEPNVSGQPQPSPAFLSDVQLFLLMEACQG